MDPYSMGILAAMQVARMGFDIWERQQQGTLTEEELEAVIDQMQARLGDTRSRLRQLIAEKRAQQGIE